MLLDIQYLNPRCLGTEKRAMKTCIIAVPGLWNADICHILAVLQPIVLDRIPKDEAAKAGGRASWIHTKALYRLRPESKDIIKGCSDDMCSTAAFLSGVKVTDWVEQD